MKMRYLCSAIPLALSALIAPISAMAWVAPFPSYSAPLTAPSAAPSPPPTYQSPSAGVGAVSGGVTQIGVGTAMGNSGFGNVSLDSALSLILPPIWTSSIPGDLGRTKVSWNGGTWLHALNHIGRTSGIHFVVNWNTQRVSATSGESYGSQDVSALGATPPAQTVEPAHIVQHPPVPTFIPVQTWTLAKNTLILTDLDQWASKSGWAIVWKAKRDWSVPNTTVYTGSVSHAVISVIKDLNYDGAMPALHYKVWNRNNTITIWQ